MSGEKHKLKYKMGNLGDVIKHGVLAEVVEWWGENETRPLVYADTFAGLPFAESNQTEIVTRGAVERLSGLENTAISRVYATDKTRYLGSSFLVKQISANFRPKSSILVSDNAQAARCGLREAGSEVIELPNCNDGYTILDDEVRRKSGQNANLILIDPYARFLFDEYNNGNCRLQKMEALAQKNIWIALFVLDMWSGGDNEKGKKWDIHKNYQNFKEAHLKDMAISFRLSKAIPAGRNKTYDPEILLISKTFADGGGRELRERLGAFKGAAEKVLSQQITMFP